jgi:rhamnosyltransferase
VRPQPNDPRPPERTSTVAIVTTFHPEPGLADRLAAVLPQVQRVLIVDNGSETAEQVDVQTMVNRGDVDVMWNDANLGLAVALNQGLRWAADRGAVWALLVDQDSQPNSGIVAEASRVIGVAGSAPVAAVGAGVFGRDRDGPPERGDWQEEVAVIASGTLISVEAWQTLGGFRRDFFVDYVDLEFCLRARAAGFRILRSLRPTIFHVIGRPARRRFLWRGVTVTHHDVARRYMMTRNRVVVWRIYWRRETRFVTADARGLAKDFVKVALFESDRRAKLHAIVAGIRDGAMTPRRSG